MSRATLALFLLLACRTPARQEGHDDMPTSPPPATSPSADAGAASADGEVEAQLRLALGPHGSGPDLRERARATDWLVAHADRAYPVVLARARTAPAAGGLALLGRFDRAESIEVLAAILERGDPLASEAAVALGAARDAAALVALRRAASQSAEPVIVAALDGLRVRKDPAGCDAILPRLAHASAEVRWMAVHAGSELGCLDRTTLEALATDDADATVRDLARQRAGTTP